MTSSETPKAESALARGGEGRRDVFEQAVALHRSGRLSEAEALYRQLLKTDGPNTKALSLLGTLLAQREAFEEAITLIRLSTQQDPRQPFALATLGNALNRTKRHQEAVTACEQAIALKRDHAPAYRILGDALVALNRAADALPHYDTAIVLKPDDAEAHIGRANAMSALEHYGKAVQGYRKAIELKADNATAHRELDRVRRLAVQRHNFLLIKAWGYGFWSDVHHVMGCLLLAEITGRVPVIHWGSNSLFSDGSGNDAFQHFFEPVTSFCIADLAACGGAAFYPAKWSGSTLLQENVAKWEGEGSQLSGPAYLRRKEAIAVSDFYVHPFDLLDAIPKSHKWHGRPLGEVYRLLVSKYLRLQPHILAEIDEFHRTQMSGSVPIIAVHVRGTDKSSESSFEIGLERYFQVIDKTTSTDWRIFLLTDQQQCVDAFRERYGSRVIFTDARRSNSDTAVHRENVPNRVRLGVEVIKDVYLALRCQKFVGHGWSNPSCFVSVLKDWRLIDCTLLGERTLLQTNFTRRFRELYGKKSWSERLIGRLRGPKATRP